jgi:phage pi2 protein 07
MAKILTIPKEILKKGDLVLIPKKEYEELLKLRKKRQWEEKDTEEAIRVFKEEKKKNKLRKINSLAELE